MEDIQDLYADISATLLALCNALDSKGLISKEELSEAFQERLLAIQPGGSPDETSPHPFLMLRQLATGLKQSPSR